MTCIHTNRLFISLTLCVTKKIPCVFGRLGMSWGLGVKDSRMYGWLVGGIIGKVSGRVQDGYA